MIKKSRHNSHHREVRTCTVFDLCIIGLMLFISFFTIPLIQTHAPATVVIYRDNTIYAEYPISESMEVEIDGHDGKMVLEIKNSTVSVQSSSCKNQICTRIGAISRPFQQIVCAPNHILIEIKARTAPEETIDAITQ